MFLNKLFTLIYHFFSSRRGILYLVTLAAIIFSALSFRNIEMSENITSMLPDGQSDTAGDFRLIQQAPFTRKVIVNLKAGPSVDRFTLIETVDRLAARMTKPFFTQVVTGPADSTGEDIFSWLIQALPSLVTDTDLERIRANLTAAKVHDRLDEFYHRLLTPEGWVIKGLIQNDPLELINIGFEKLGYLKLIPQMRIEENHFISVDGKNVLLIADTPIEITDSRGAEKMLTYFDGLVQDAVPREIEVSLISGHRYSVANASAIKKDVFLIISCASLAILFLFLIFLRSLRAVYVFLVPVSVLCVAGVGVSLFYTTVSAITIGFGSVLLGISVDFALHVYFALRIKDSDPAVVIGQISHPVLFGGLTTIAAFAVLLLSDLPGQRQLAVFSMIGIGMAMIISLTILPHLIKPEKKIRKLKSTGSRAIKRLPGIWVISIWLIIVGLCLWQARHIRIDGDLRSLNLVPPDIRLAENNLKQTWGDFRGTAMIFVKGDDMQKALANNDLLFSFLSQNLPKDQIISLAPIIPSQLTQGLNQERWAVFWASGNRKLAKELLETEGKSFGFSTHAFSPFFDNLKRQPTQVLLQDLQGVGLGAVFDSLVIESKNKEPVKILTLVPDTPKVHELMEKHEDRLGARLVSQTRFNTIVGTAIRNDFIGFIIKASLVVIFLLIILFRRLKNVFCALIPVITGLICMFGIMGWQNIGFNLFNIVAAILVIGLGVDYGIFMVFKIREGYKHNTDRAVLVSGLTTLAGFGALVFARHPALHSIGVTVLLGITAAIPAALLVIPVFYRKK